MMPQELSHTERLLLDHYQQCFPLESRPYQVIAEQLGVSESYVIETLRRLQDEGVISRVGPVFYPNRVGSSTLAAMAVPEERLDEVAQIVSRFGEVNHNYQREHEFNLWFVVTAEDRGAVEQVLEDIHEATGLAVMDLPMLEDYFIDLGFKLQWT